jgi:surface protein
MDSMFESATSFNQPIGAWDVSNVRDMDWKTFIGRLLMFMFTGSFALNQAKGDWDVFLFKLRLYV